MARKEQIVLMTLQFILIVVVIGTVAFWYARGKNKAENEDAMSANQQTNIYHQKDNGKDGAPASPESITFDPNTADSATFVRVGLSPMQARNIIKYRQKGWQCHRPEDFKKIYGLTVGQWEHLRPLIKIDKKYQYLADNEDVYRQPAYTMHKSRDNNDDSPMKSKYKRTDKIQEGETIDLATADTTSLKRIPGIGSYYSRKIMEYENKLGGYYSLDQINDKALDFLPLGIENYMTISTPNIRQLHINSCTVKQLTNHPYITYPQAKQLADRIRLYGPIKSWDEILFLSEFSSKDKERLEPYICFE